MLREDARATLRVPLAGLVGELNIELDAGGLAAPWPEGRVMDGVAEGDPAVKARETVEQIREQIPLMLSRSQSIPDRTDAILAQAQRAGTAENADQLVRSLDRLARAVEREEAVAHASRALAEAEQLLQGVREGRGTLGRLATDEALYDRTAVLLDDLHASWAKLDALMGASARLADRASELADRARSRGADLRGALRTGAGAGAPGQPGPRPPQRALAAARRRPRAGVAGATRRAGLRAGRHPAACSPPAGSPCHGGASMMTSAMRHPSPSAARLAGLVLLATAACAAPRPPPAEALALRQRTAGETARRLDDPRTAAALYGRASSSAAAGDRSDLAADAACRQGLALLAAGDAALAVDPLERGAVLARQAGNLPLSARALLGLARARRTTGQGDVAGPLQQARTLATAGGDRVAAALAELGLGSLGSAGGGPDPLRRRGGTGR